MPNERSELALLHGDEPQATIAGRIDRLPIGRWQIGLAIVVGLAFFVDGFDTAAIAYVAPVLRKLWKISPLAIGALIAAGYGGQTMGAFCSGFVAERLGRAKAAFLAIGIASCFSLACSVTATYPGLFLARFAQGVGLGALLPVVLIYINEMIPSRVRGRINFLVTTGFGIGIFTSTLTAAFLIPAFGWQSIFIVGGLPLLVLPLAWRYCPESVQWLARNGHFDKADALLAKVETRMGNRALAPLALRMMPERAIAMTVPGEFAADSARDSLAVFLTPVNIRRLILVVALGLGSVIPAYGVSNWMPTILTANYGVPVALAIKFSLSVSAAGLMAMVIYALVIDRFDHLKVLSWVLIGGSLPLFGIYLLRSSSPWVIALLAAFSYLGILIGSPGASLLTAELFPVEFRARAMGILSACTRFGILVSPLIVGFTLGRFGAPIVFLVLAGTAATSGIICRVMRATL